MQRARIELERVGAEALSIRDLAMQAGVSKAAPYRHFPDKSALLVELSREGMAMLRKAMAESGNLDDAIGRMRGMGRAYVRFAGSKPGLFRLLFSAHALGLDDPSILEEGEASLAVLRDGVRDAQRQGWRSKEDTDQLTLAAWAHVHGVAMLRMEALIRPAPETQNEFWESLAEAFVRS